MNSPLNDPFSVTSLIAFASIALLLGAIAMKSFWHLRLLLLLASAGLVIYALIVGKPLVLIVSAIALLINGFRAFEIQNVSRRIRRTRHYGYELAPLLPLMHLQSLNEGERVFTKGERADHLYVLTKGKIRFDEHEVTIEAGEKGTLFGEFGLFTKSGIRTSSATCASPVELRSLTAEEVDRLYFQQPEFGYALAKIMATRMAGNIENLEGQLHQY